MMDLIEKVLDMVVPAVGITALLLILPPYLFFKFVVATIRRLFIEDVAGKVILITGASSGIGEYVAYEYAKRGACLAVVARREERLLEVAEVARQLGAPDVIVIRADVSKLEDCISFVDQTVNHFGRLDHLVANAGIAPVCLFEEIPDITKLQPSMDINFWGSVYSSYCALAHLKISRGKIIVIASAAGWLPAPRLSFYSASKAALISFYESLRSEVWGEVGITIVTPGLIESEMTQGKFLSKDGLMILDSELRDVEVSIMPVRSVTAAAEEIVKGACRGDNYLTEPAWINPSYYWMALFPELVEWVNRVLLMTHTSNNALLSKKLLDWTGLKQFVYPPSVQYPPSGEPTT